MSEELVPLARTGNAIRRLIAQHGRFPEDLRKRLPPKMRQVSQPLLMDARRRASWSKRIPAALRIATSFTRRQAGVSLVANRTKAPHARVYEGIRGNADFRHPVFPRFGRREVWVEQRTRPFAQPAADLHGASAVRAVNEAVDEAAHAAGYGK